MSAASGTLLIRDAHVLALDDADREWPRADIVVEDGRIVALGPDAAEQWRASVRAHDRRHGPARDARPHQRAFPFARQPDEGLPARLSARSVHALRGAAARCRGRRPAGSHTFARCSARWRCCAAASPPSTTTPITYPVATPESIDAIMQAYDDAGIRATVAIDQPNVVEYEKYPYLADLLPAPSARRWTRRRARRRRSCSRSTPSDRALARRGADGRLAAAVSCSAPQRVTPDYFAGAVGAVEATRPAVQHAHPRDQAAARARPREVRQVAGSLRARSRAARRADDGDPRASGSTTTTSGCWPKRAAPSRTIRSAICGSAAA